MKNNSILTLNFNIISLFKCFFVSEKYFTDYFNIYFKNSNGLLLYNNDLTNFNEYILFLNESEFCIFLK